MIDSLPAHFDRHAFPLLLSSSSLTSVEISGSVLEGPWFFQIGLPLLSSRSSTRLKSLSIHHDTVVVEPSFWSILPSFRQLEELDVSLPQSMNMPRHFLPQIGRFMDQLTDLSLDVHLPNHIMPPGHSTNPIIEDSAQPKRGGSELFPSLERLSIVSRMETNLCQCFSIPALIPHVTSLTLCYTSETALDSLPRIAHDLSRYPSLRTLTLKEDPDDDLDLTLYLDQIVPAIQSCTHLEQLHLNSISYIGGRGDESGRECLDAVLSATLPSPGTENRALLRRLHMAKTWQDHIGLDELGNLLLTKAPHLQELQIAFNSQHIPRCELVDAVDSTSKLTRLSILDIPPTSSEFHVPEHEYVARFLDSHFPRLCNVVLCNPMGEDLKTHWDHINHLRGLYQQIRVLSLPPGSRYD